MPLRFSIKWLLIAAVYVAIVGAALKQGWWLWADVLWGIGWLAWGYAALMACFRTGAARAGAIGFTLLAACYATSLHFAPATLPTARLLNAIGIDEGWERNDQGLFADEDDLFGPPEPPPLLPPSSLDPDPFGDAAVEVRPANWEQKLRAAHSAGAMLAGFAGLCLGLLVWRQSQKGITPNRGAAILLMALMASGAAYGQDGPITYVDATHGAGGNTRLATGADFLPPVAEVAGENQSWSLQLYGNEATVYTAEGGNAPSLVTTLTGLTPGERYHVLIYYWTVSGGGGIEASLTPLAASDIAAPKVAPPSTPEPAEATPDMFNAEVLVEEDGRQLTPMSLGQVAADEQGEIRIWIDDVPGSTSSTPTWYDGVGYAAEPEPPPVEVGSALDWWPWIVMLAVGFIVFIMIAARRRGRGSMIDDATAT